MNVEPWNEFDPVANALLALIEAQNVVQRTSDATGEERDEGTLATDAEVDAVLVARSDAITAMLAAQTEFCGVRRVCARIFVGGQVNERANSHDETNAALRAQPRRLAAVDLRVPRAL